MVVAYAGPRDPTAMTATASEPQTAAHALQCMEIWGGNEAIDNAISVPGIDAWVVSEVYHGDARGGDVHYISMCGAGRITRFMLADVAGHGEGVGELGRSLRKLMRRNINTLNQVRFARALNKQFASAGRVGQFATALLTTYFAPTDHLVICNAGHPRPLWYRAQTRQWHLLDGEADAPPAPLAADAPPTSDHIANPPDGYSVISPSPNTFG